MSKDKKIKELEEKKKTANGQLCEVYSRIVGYFRPTFAWNEGKAEEYKKRAIYKVGEK